MVMTSHPFLPILTHRLPAGVRVERGSGCQGRWSVPSNMVVELGPKRELILADTEGCQKQEQGTSVLSFLHLNPFMGLLSSVCGESARIYSLQFIYSLRLSRICSDSDLNTPKTPQGNIEGGKATQGPDPGQ